VSRGEESKIISDIAVGESAAETDLEPFYRSGNHERTGELEIGRLEERLRDWSAGDDSQAPGRLGRLGRRLCGSITCTAGSCGHESCGQESAPADEVVIAHIES
jgi:hypothetical protein